MVGGADLLDVEEDTLVADDVVGHVMHIVDGHIVADVARNDAAVGDAHRNAKIMVLEDLVGHASDTAQPKEMVVADHAGIELVGHHDLIPVGRRIAVFHQLLDLVGMKVTPTRNRMFYLLVTIVILIMSIVEILLIDEVFVDPIVR